MAAGAAVWTAIVGAAAIWRHDQFLSHRFDLGNMVQAVWSTAHGRPLEMTDAATGEQITRLGAHVDPILVLFAPLSWLVPGPELLHRRAGGGARGGHLPGRSTCARRTRSRRVASCLLGAWYLVFPWVVWEAFDDFHPVTLAIPLLLYSVWFLDQHRLRPFAVVATLALLTGELDRPHRCRPRESGTRSGTAGTGPEGSSLSSARVGRRLCFAGHRPCLQRRPVEPVLRALRDTSAARRAASCPPCLTHPLRIVDQLTDAGDLRYVLWLLLPTAFLALLTPLVPRRRPAAARREPHRFVVDGDTRRCFTTPRRSSRS